MKKILIVLFAWLQFYSVNAQDTTITRDELRVMASESFVKSDFTSASVYYKRLLDYYPKDPVYHFYLGACREEMGEDINDAIHLLEFASARFSPPEVFYYLGAAYQKSGEFEKAAAAYRHYMEKASRKDVATKQVELRLNECKNGQKLTAHENLVTVQNVLPVRSDSLQQPVKKTIEIPKEVKTEKEKPVVFPPKTTADESGYMEMLNEALRVQMKSDSLVREAERLRREIAETTDWNQKKKTLAEINVLQTEADNLQNHANTLYSKARGLEMKFVRNSGKQATVKLDSTKNTIPVKKEVKPIVKTEVATDKIKKEEQTPPIQNEFFILEHTPYSTSNPIPVDSSQHSGILYKIQVGVFSKPVEFQQFRGLSPISAERIVENGFTRYYAGAFSNIKDTELALEKVRNYGFRESFIVSFYNGKKISLIRAREIEQMLKTN